MSLQYWDSDEYELVSHFTPCWCQTAKMPCNGHCMGSGGQSYRRRSDEEIATIKTAKRLLHEENVLREADAVRARRYQG